MTRILVTGSRNWKDEEAIRRELEEFPQGTPLAHGAAPGADRIADKVGRSLHLIVVPFPADWQRHGNGAGPIRNQRMLDEFRPTLVIAFPLPESVGTWDMVRRAKAKGVEVRIVT